MTWIAVLLYLLGIPLGALYGAEKLKPGEPKWYAVVASTIWPALGLFAIFAGAWLLVRGHI